MAKGARVGRITLTASRTVARGFLRAVLDALNRMPDEFDQLFGGRGLDVYVDRRWTDIWPDWEPEKSTLGHRGSGYDNWAQCSAYYSTGGRRVMMVEEIRWDGEWESDRDNAFRTLTHELGHALDYTSDPRPSQDPEFRDLYLTERESAKAVEALDYYTHHWAAGVLEVFASGFEASLGPLYPYEDDAFREHFSGCIDWVSDYATSCVSEMGGSG